VDQWTKQINKEKPMTDTRRFIRDTVADNYRPDYLRELDRRMKWLDQLHEACKDQPKGLILEHAAE
jgi:hypothetical protein